MSTRLKPIQSSAAAKGTARRARAKTIAEGREFESEVRERERYWLDMGVNGVPFTVINDAYAIEGAQPPEAFQQALRQIANS